MKMERRERFKEFLY